MGLPFSLFLALMFLQKSGTILMGARISNERVLAGPSEQALNLLGSVLPFY